ncbi:MAG: hypothetical protein K0Q68_377 [Moraxellaceae bacterium]|jgi:uncharacterized membrane protein|nr:hypothetical protein [Moraxellaceae bacterium]
MAFVFALGFVLMVLIAGQWQGRDFFLALVAGLGLGAWLKALIDQRIRRLAGEMPARPVASAPPDVYAALEDIHWRLKRLEETQGLGASPLEAERAAAEDITLELESSLHTVAPDVAVAVAPAAAPGLSSHADDSIDSAAAGLAAPPAERLPEPPAAAEPAAAPPRPGNTPDADPLDALLTRCREWLLGGNTVVRVGIVVLFFGVAFLLKFAIDRAVLPLELRVAGVGAGAIALLAIGWRLRRQREAYALALQGAGVGLLYLTLFGAFRLYQLLPPGVAFAAMVAVAGLSALLALLQNSAALISIGVTGGFLAPILASTGSGNHVALFSYYLVLNLGIFAVAWTKAWRPLNLLGFFFTVAIGLLWGSRAYTPALLASTEPFLLVFFALFLTVSILFGLHRSEEQALPSGMGEPLPPRVVDGTLVFGLPLVAFGFQAALMKGTEFGLTLSALGLSALYLGLARWLLGRQREHLERLVESFLALGVIFATLAIPLALDARWTSASWALEGAALVWVGLHQRRQSVRVFGLLLQFAAALAWVVQPGSWSADTLPVVNAFCLGALLIALAALFTAWQLQTRQQPASALALPLFVWGVGWWLLAGLGEAHVRFDGDAFHAFAALFLAASAALASAAEKRLQWPHARLPAEGLVVALAWLLLHTLWEGLHAFGGGGWLAWPAALALHYALLQHRDTDAQNPTWSLRVHGLGFWLLALLGSHELHWLAQHYALAGGWRMAALVVAPAALLLAVSNDHARARWPLRGFAPAYLGWGAFPVLAGLALWVLLTDLGHNGDPAPLPWLPLLNPVDIAHLFLGLVALRWAQRVQAAPADTGVTPDPRAWSIALGVLAFVWLNSVLLRSIHHWTDLPYTPRDLLDSTLVQAALSLFWTVLALVLMATGTRRGLRVLWMTGAGLMGVVVVKLFIIDLDRVGSVARIVSFMGVGLLMLLIGYLAPVPPKTTLSPDADSPEA